MPDLQQMLNELLSSGQLSSELTATIQAALADPQKLDEVLATLSSMGADQIGSGPPLVIESFYRDGPGKYELRWPLPPHLVLPIAFDQLDRKTQFHVLFQEWTRREMDGMMSLTTADVDGAAQTFDECLERADQIDVGELRARSYEGQVRVAQRRGDLVAERDFVHKAADARRA